MATKDEMIESAIKLEYKDGVISYQAIDLKKETDEGLEFLREMCLAQERYEWASEVRDEINKRKTGLNET